MKTEGKITVLLQKKKIVVSVLALTAVMGVNGAAFASDDSIDEIRLGVYSHDSALFGDRRETSDPDINGEVLLKSPDWLAWAWSPRPQIGANINTGNGTDVAYAGLAWDYDLSQAVFVEGGVGGAIHDGALTGYHNDSRQYGCRLNFHLDASLGYRFDEHNSLMLTADHMSNADLCSKNEGLSDIGIRYGFTF